MWESQSSSSGFFAWRRYPETVSPCACEEEEFVKLTEDFVLQYKVAAGEIASLQFLPVLLQNSCTRRPPAWLSLFHVFRLYFY